MKFYKFIIVVMALMAVVTACKKDDDDSGIVAVPPRDRAEVDSEDQLQLQTYLETHFYNYEEFENPAEDFDYVVRFDTIAGVNSDKTALFDRPELMTKTFDADSINYNLYILKIREGVGDVPRYSDSIFLNYRGELLTDELFDSATQPIWFDLPGGSQSPGVIEGFTSAIIEFKEASGFSENPDNTISFNNDFGIGAVFMPSGLGYFNLPPPGVIDAYDPLIFSFQLFVSEQADHDNDGIPSFLEDLNENQNLVDDDTDANGLPNYVSSDDDGDGILTRDEITSEDLNDDGEITIDEIIFTDSNNDGTPDYLQADVDGSSE